MFSVDLNPFMTYPGCSPELISSAKLLRNGRLPNSVERRLGMMETSLRKG